MPNTSTRVLYRLPDGSTLYIPFDGPDDSRHGKTITFQLHTGEVVMAVRVGDEE